MNRIVLSLLLFFGLPGVFTGTAANPAQAEFFEQRIRPMLANECYECHGAKKQKGGLRLDYRDALLKGGDSGPALIAGDANKSLLIQAIRHEHEDSQMPKDRPKFSDAVIADFVAWVNAGANDPRDQPPAELPSDPAAWGTIFAARKDWWSFKPLQKPLLPIVKNTNWSAHPVDQFLLAKMEERGLQPASAADRRSLLRRVTFALTGLPPTLDELHAFLNDPAPDAYATAVERLLNSPRFGERWARHWMDLVRFAETHGSESDPDIPNAWQYRDYLIRAFNADVPLDQLIREHLAGDLMASPRWNPAEGINESMIGVAHFRLVEHGFNPVDTLDEQVKTVDSQIDVVSKAFQGLTISCARCHDHKFDPISQRDYYALYGIFASTRPTHLTIDAPDRLRVHREELEALKQRIKSAVGEAWEQTARAIPGKLLNGGAPDAIPGDEIKRRITELEQRLVAIERAGQKAVLHARGITNTSGSIASPIAAWTFDADARDGIGGLHGELQGGAKIRNGRLVLDGKGAFLRTAPLEHALREKTLEAWVTPANLDQRGGGVLTVESMDGVVFDAIVFAEKEPRKWTVGSDGYQRSKNLDGPDESATSRELVHVAITYQPDNSIALFRNGLPYGAAYKPSGNNATLRTFEAKSARVLLGMRHTGGGNPFFAGEIEEARLHDRALSPLEVKASFDSGPGLVSDAAISLALTPEQRTERERIEAELVRQRAALQKDFPDYAERDDARARLRAAWDAALKNENHPLNLWQELRGKSGGDFSAGWDALVKRKTDNATARTQSNREKFQFVWDFRDGEVKPWFLYGINPPETASKPGEFAIEPDGDRIFPGLLPAGIFSHRLSQKHNGVLASPSFKVTTDNISVRVLGGKGARVRLIVDNYPIGQGNIFPQASLKSDAPTWVRLDTAYRKGSMAYLEFATAEDVTSRDRSPPGPGGRSYYGVEQVVFHDAKETPADEITAQTIFIRGAAPSSREDLAKKFGEQLSGAVAAWRNESLTEEQRQLLDAFLRSGLLPGTLKDLPIAAPLVAEYRRLEAEIPVPRRAPGVLEAEPYDSPLLARGDHLKPLDPVPRAYLSLFSGQPYPMANSGRLELAEEIASATNPLTARVLVNRVWHYLFGRGLVATVDNFGRLGEKPSHPELLDYLATELIEQGWSAKELIRSLVTTRAYQMSDAASERANEIDPANELLSHMRVRRLEAESIRDSLLAVSGRLDPAMFGPGANALAAPAEQKRRSIYLTVRRNFLSPFLEAFDLPKPFSTLGRRETTNVPAQSLALLNDPFVIEQAMHWARATLAAESGRDERIRRMFEMAFARMPSETELAGSRAYLEELTQAQGPGNEMGIWRDLAQSLFNLKEFIYIR